MYAHKCERRVQNSHFSQNGMHRHVMRLQEIKRAYSTVIEYYFTWFANADKNRHFVWNNNAHFLSSIQTGHRKGKGAIHLMTLGVKFEMSNISVERGLA